MDRRTFLRRGLALVGVAAVGPLVELRAPVAEVHPAPADPPLVLLPPPSQPLISWTREIRELGGVSKTGGERAVVWFPYGRNDWMTFIPEAFTIGHLQTIWNSRPITLQEPARIILAPQDFTAYGNLLTGLKRWRPDRDLGHGTFAMLEFYGVPVLEVNRWGPGTLALEA